jgi:isocitrate lyase
METSTPDLDVAREFAESVRKEFPDQMLAYNCSPSFNWRANLDDETIAKFGKELAAMGYRFQFITLAGFHALNYSMFDLATGFAAEGMPAYVRLQEREFAAEKSGYTATRHQREAGTGYFDLVTTAISPASETVALRGSTEADQFVALSRKICWAPGGLGLRGQWGAWVDLGLRTGLRPVGHRATAVDHRLGR